MGLNNTQFDTLMRDYDRQRLENQRVQGERLAEVLARCPAYGDLDAEAAAAGLQAAKALLAGDSGAQDALQATLDDVRSRRARLLEEAGFAPDYLDPVYRCPDCHDTGFVDGRRCHCFKQASADLLYRQSGLREVLQQENFDTFDLSFYSEQEIDPRKKQSARQSAREARRIAEDFVARFDTSFENLYLYGNPGTGKTFLSHCIAKALMDTGHSVVYTNATRLEQLLFERSRSRESGDYDSLLSCDLLIIDDLGTETVNSLNVSALYDLLNERFLARKSVLISTNKSITDLASIYTTRIYSRLMAYYRVVYLHGSDIRIKKRLSAKAASLSN